MNWYTLLSLFAGPIGQLITTALSAGSAAFVSWQVSKGVPLDAASNIAGGLVTAISGAVSMLTGSQGVHISAVNAANNGVKVVPATVNAPVANGPLK